ncbi:MAG: response regulator transcription factor [Ferruginibacter sp.]
MKTAEKNISIGITDDQQLFLKSLGTLINTFHGFSVVLDSMNGEELLRKLSSSEEFPDILLIDVNMPVMDGVETTRNIADRYPMIKVVALSMKDDDTTIINMIRAGASAYLLKDIHPDELEKALKEIYETGYYNADQTNINYRRLMLHEQKEKALQLTEKELTFLKLSCSDLTYKQIAAQMFLAERTVDGYRESVFKKLNVQSRVGMAMEAIRKGIVTI